MMSEGSISWDELEGCSKARKTSILFRLAGAIAIVLLFSIAANSFLNYFSFQKSYQQIIRSKFTAIVEELGFKIESSLNLGLPLSAMANVPSLLNETSQHHEDVRFLVVESSEGEIYFSAGKQHRRASTDDQSDFVYDKENSIWVSSGPQVTIVGYDLFNSFQKLEGRLLLGYDQTQLNYTQQKVAWSLARESVIVLTLFVIIGFFSLYLIVYKFRLKLSVLEQQLVNVANRADLDPRVSKEVMKINQSPSSLIKPGNSDKPSNQTTLI